MHNEANCSPIPLGLDLRVANRDFEKALALAKHFNGSAIHMEYLHEFIEPDEVLKVEI